MTDEARRGDVRKHWFGLLFCAREGGDATTPPPPTTRAPQHQSHSRPTRDRRHATTATATTIESKSHSQSQSNRADRTKTERIRSGLDYPLRRRDYRSDPAPPWQGGPRTIHTRSGLVWRKGGRPCVSARSNRPDRAITTTSALAMSFSPTSRATRCSRRGFVLAHSVVAVVARSTSTRRACWTTLSSARSFDKLELSSHI